jgi:hypothetical protein
MKGKNKENFENPLQNPKGREDRGRREFKKISTDHS